MGLEKAKWCLYKNKVWEIQEVVDYHQFNYYLHVKFVGRDETFCIFYDEIFETEIEACEALAEMLKIDLEWIQERIKILKGGDEE
jgi:hypothetical protein